MDKRFFETGNLFPGGLTKQEKLQALRKFSQLLPEEREKLKLPIQPHDNLFEQLKKTITDEIRGLDEEKIITFYKQAIALSHSLKQNQSNSELEREILEYETKEIRRLVEKRIKEYYSDLEPKAIVLIGESNLLSMRYFVIKNKERLAINKLKIIAGGKLSIRKQGLFMKTMEMYS